MVQLLADLDMTQELVDESQITQVETKSPTNKRKAPKKEKLQITIVESLHLSTMAISYHIHFATYSNGKKNVT
jgi:hypothetical protein